jgi:hypothetical protein
MGRTLKRVPMDFNWPLNNIWDGYLNPYHGRQCPTCKGSGQNAATHLIEEEWYALNNRKDIWLDGNRTRSYNDNAHCYHLTKVEVDALLARNRLSDLRKKLGRDPTVEEVNDWAIHDPMGHDEINRSICVKARAEELGVYGFCPACDGDGEVWDSPESKQKCDSWKPQEPPAGPGFQLWETTTEGSPQSPVFATLGALAAWCEKNATVFASATAKAEDWERMLLENKVHYREGNKVFI